MSFEQAYMLSPADIKRIRQYVHRKYEHLPSREQAEIVADAVTRVIERQLPDFPIEVKKDITSKLITRVIVPQGRPVSIEDIDHICQPYADADDSLKEVLSSWQKQHNILVESAISESEEPFLQKLAEFIKSKKGVIGYGGSFIFVVLAIVLYSFFTATDSPTQLEPQMTSAPIIEETLMYNELPQHLQFVQIDDSKLQSYLLTRNSLLVDEPYYSAIIEVAKQFNIHPVLLFAITGQEQAFVNRDHEQAKEIANNPFNVYHSWKDFNTNIEESTTIAARTIVRLAADRPEDVDPIKWINRQYAEDPNWNKGVSSLFQTILDHMNMID